MEYIEFIKIKMSVYVFVNVREEMKEGRKWDNQNLIEYNQIKLSLEHVTLKLQKLSKIENQKFEKKKFQYLDMSTFQTSFTVYVLPWMDSSVEQMISSFLEWGKHQNTLPHLKINLKY